MEGSTHKVARPPSTLQAPSGSSPVGACLGGGLGNSLRFLPRLHTGELVKPARLDAGAASTAGKPGGCVRRPAGCGFGGDSRPPPEDKLHGRQRATTRPSTGPIGPRRQFPLMSDVFHPSSNTAFPPQSQCRLNSGSLGTMGPPFLGTDGHWVSPAPRPLGLHGPWSPWRNAGSEGLTAEQRRPLVLGTATSSHLPDVLL